MHKVAIRCSAMFAGKPAAAADRSPKISVVSSGCPSRICHSVRWLHSYLVSFDDVKRSCALVHLGCM